MTDGKGEMPELPPSLATLWVIMHDDPFHAEWGSIVRLAGIAPG